MKIATKNTWGYEPVPTSGSDDIEIRRRIIAGQPVPIGLRIEDESAVQDIEEADVMPNYRKGYVATGVVEVPNPEGTPEGVEPARIRSSEDAEAWEEEASEKAQAAQKAADEADDANPQVQAQREAAAAEAKAAEKAASAQAETVETESEEAPRQRRPRSSG